MKKQYTKKQITEAIAYWKKQLKKLNESNNATNLSIVTILNALDWFDACALWPDAISQMRMPKEAVNAIGAVFEKYHGKTKAIGVRTVLSRQEYEDEIEMHNDRPYEDYLDDEKYKFLEAFDDNDLRKALKPSELILVDGIEVIEVDSKIHSAFVALYTI